MMIARPVTVDACNCIPFFLTITVVLFFDLSYTASMPKVPSAKTVWLRSNGGFVSGFQRYTNWVGSAIGVLVPYLILVSFASASRFPVNVLVKLSVVEFPAKSVIKTAFPDLAVVVVDRLSNPVTTKSFVDVLALMTASGYVLSILIVADDAVS